MGSSAKKKEGVIAMSTGKSGSGKQTPLLIGTIIILAITIVSFVLVPALSGTDSFNINTELGRFGNKPIKWVEGNYFDNQLKRYKEQYSQYLNGDTDPATAEWLNQIVWKTAYDETVTRTAMIYFMEKSGFAVSSESVDEVIVSYFSENGVFNQQAWNEYPSSKKILLRKQIEEDTIAQAYVGDLYYSQFNNQNQIDYLKSMGATKRNFRFVLFKMEDYPQAKVQEYGTAHGDLFKKVRLGRITVAKKKDAEDLKKSVLAGEKSFDDLALEFSIDGYAQVGGDLGWVFMHSLQDTLKDDQREKILAMKKGEVSEPVQTAYGWAIYVMKEEITAPDFNDPAMLDEVRGYLVQNEAGVIEDYLMERGKSFTGQARLAGFDAAAVEFGKTPEDSGLYPLNYNVGFIKGNIAYLESLSLAGVGSSVDFFTNCFSLKAIGDITEPVLMDRTVGVFMLLDEQPSLEPVDDREVTGFALNAKQSYFSSMIKKSPLFVDKFDETFAKFFKPAN
jgi:hypothetical protein